MNGDQQTRSATAIKNDLLHSDRKPTREELEILFLAMVCRDACPPLLIYMDDVHMKRYICQSLYVRCVLVQELNKRAVIKDIIQLLKIGEATVYKYIRLLTDEKIQKLSRCPNLPLAPHFVSTN